MILMMIMNNLVLMIAQDAHCTGSTRQLGQRSGENNVSEKNKAEAAQDAEYPEDNQDRGLSDCQDDCDDFVYKIAKAAVYRQYDRDWDLT